MSSCPLCGAPKHAELECYDDRYGYPGSFTLLRCKRCGFGALDCRFSAEEQVRLYTNYYPRSTFSLEKFTPARSFEGFSAWWHGRRRLAYTWVPEGVKVLDIGCGFGETLAYHRDRGCEAHGVEADENILRVAERFGLNARAGLFEPGNYPAGYFDYVTLDQVVEHMSAPVEALRGVAQVLKPGGTAVLSTPNSRGWGAWLFGRRWINWHAPYHLSHFSRTSLELLARQAGLQVERIRTVTSPEWFLYQMIHQLTCPKPGVASPFWAPLAQRGYREKLIFALCRAVHRTQIGHLLTRIFDALGVGDNFLVILRKPL